MTKVKMLMTSLAMTMFIALSFSANAQTDRVTVTNNTACDMTVGILGSGPLFPCSNSSGQEVAIVPAGAVRVLFFQGIKLPATTTNFTGAGALETDALGMLQGTGASQDLCTTTSVTGAGPSCGNFTVTITGPATMSID